MWKGQDAASLRLPGAIDLSTERLHAPVKVIKVMKSLVLSQQLHVGLDLVSSDHRVHWNLHSPVSAALLPTKLEQSGIHSRFTEGSVCHWDVASGEFAGSCWVQNSGSNIKNRDNAGHPTKVALWSGALTVTCRSALVIGRL